MSEDKDLKQFEEKIDNTLSNFTKSISKNVVQPEKTGSYYLYIFWNRWVLFFIFLFFIFGPFFEIISKSYITLGEIITNLAPLRSIIGIDGARRISELVSVNLVLLPLYFILSENLSKKFQNLQIKGTIFFFIVIVFLGIVNMQSIDVAKQSQDVAYNVGETSVNFLTKFKCNTYGELIGDEECIALKNQVTNHGKVSSNQRVSVNYITKEDDFNQVTLDSKDDYYTVSYDFETSIPIKIKKIECFIKGEKKAFYNKSFDNKIISMNTQENFKCRDLGKVLEKKITNLQIISKLYFSIENQISQKIPFINCNNENIKLILDKGSRKCEDLTINYLEEKINNLASFEKNPQTGNSFDVSIVQNTLYPLHIGDKAEEKELQMSIKGRSNVGEIQSIKIENIKLPYLLNFNGQNNYKDKIIYSEKDRNNGIVRIKLIEKEAKISDSIDFDVIPLLINTTTILVKKGYSNDLTIKADFIEEEKKEDQIKVSNTIILDKIEKIRQELNNFNYTIINEDKELNALLIKINDVIITTQKYLDENKLDSAEMSFNILEQQFGELKLKYNIAKNNKLINNVDVKVKEE